MNNWRTYGGAAVLFSAFLLLPPSVMADKAGKGKAEEGPVSVAKKHFLKGVSFFKAGDYEAALVEFLESNRLNPHWSLKYNIATCYMLIFEYAKSLKIFREYMKEGGEAVPADRKKIVLKNMASLKTKVGMVIVNCNVQGASLIVDDVEKHDTIAPEGVVF
ncbi:MAG: hypothetical protein ABIJ56_14100, partial [Pseudomonadota bacterium]